MTDFTGLLQPGRIGTMQLKNRFVFTGVHTGLCEPDGAITAAYCDYVLARARGGAGLITVGGASPHPSGKGLFGQMGADRDDFVPAWRALVDGIHAAGTRAMLQIMHVGRYCYPDILGMQTVAPSALTPRIPRGRPRELETQEVRDMVQDHAAAAARGKAAGFDAIELQAATGYLIASFLSPYSNQRTDEYGGDFAGRTRFLMEIIRATREKIGDRFPFVCRLNADDLLPGEGNTVEDNIRIAQMAADAGVDAISLTTGWHESRIPSVTMDVPIGNWTGLAKSYRQALNVPVIMAYQLTTPAAAALALSEGAVDFVGMARPLTADPDFPRKLQEGRPEDITPCLLCNTCFEKLTSHGPIRCTMNTAAGQEAAAEVRPAATPKRVMVVGGGPAGLTAARVAALRGHKVTLYEQSDTLGGQVLLAAAVPFRQRLAAVYEYLALQARKAGAVIVSGREVTPDLVEGEKPDVVILATGALPAIPPAFQRYRSAVSAWDVLSGQAQVTDNVVVVGAGLVGVGVAEWLAERGKTVTIVEALKRAAADAPPFDRTGIMHRLAQHKIQLVLGATVEKVENGVVTVSKLGAGQQEILADTAVIAVGANPSRSLLPALQGMVPEVYTIGDCVEPRRIYHAIHEASSLAREI